MSLQYTEEVVCPCGEAFETELYQTVSIEEDSALKEVILAGELNVVRCPSCFQLVYMERFVLYHDSSQELLAFVYPREMSATREKIGHEMGRAFHELQNGLEEGKKITYKPFLLFGLDALCDLLMAEESIADESAVVSSICDTLKLVKKKIGFDAARRMNIPPILPFLKAAGSGGGRSKSGKSGDENLSQEHGKNNNRNLLLQLASDNKLRENLLGGLKRVLGANDRLEYYMKFKERVESGEKWGEGTKMDKFSKSQPA